MIVQGKTLIRMNGALDKFEKRSSAKKKRNSVPNECNWFE
jgi:hypothetical protein